MSVEIAFFPPQFIRLLKQLLCCVFVTSIVFNTSQHFVISGFFFAGHITEIVFHLAHHSAQYHFSIKRSSKPFRTSFSDAILPFVETFSDNVILFPILRVQESIRYKQHFLTPSKEQDPKTNIPDLIILRTIKPEWRFSDTHYAVTKSIRAIPFSEITTAGF